MYHTIDDTIDVIDLVFLTEVTDLVTASLADLAEPGTPSWGCAIAARPYRRMGGTLTLLLGLWIWRRSAEDEQRSKRHHA